MATYIPTATIQIDLTKPVEEIQQCILLIANAHPGKQKEILEQVEMWLGGLLVGIEKGAKQAEATAESDLQKHHDQNEATGNGVT